jgi:signal transduction histidine kinase
MDAPQPSGLPHPGLALTPGDDALRASERRLREAQRVGRIGSPIEDRGAGFDVQRVPERSAAGLSGMRARLLAGRLTIDAAPLAGTRLLLELPLAAALRGDSG